MLLQRVLYKKKNSDAIYILNHGIYGTVSTKLVLTVLTVQNVNYIIWYSKWLVQSLQSINIQCQILASIRTKFYSIIWYHKVQARTFFDLNKLKVSPRMNSIKWLNGHKRLSNYQINTKTLNSVNDMKRKEQFNYRIK